MDVGNISYNNDAKTSSGGKIILVVLGVLCAFLAGFYITESKKQLILQTLAEEKEREAVLLKAQFAKHRETVLEILGEQKGLFGRITGIEKRESAYEQEVNTGDWKVYRNEKYAFEVRIPPTWGVVRISDTEKSIAFGDSAKLGKGYDGEWFIVFYNKGEDPARQIEGIISSMGSQFRDRQETREKVFINDVAGTHVKIVTPSAPDWQYEAVILQQFERIIVLNNGAIKNDLFPAFYKNFNLIKK